MPYPGASPAQPSARLSQAWAPVPQKDPTGKITGVAMALFAQALLEKAPKQAGAGRSGFLGQPGKLGRGTVEAAAV
jgi:hypothetical protein